MMIESVDPIAKIITGVRFDEYRHDLSKFLAFSAPRLADVGVVGPDPVIIGSTAVFNVAITEGGEAYPAADIAEVKYLAFDATGALAFSGTGVVTGDGAATITLTVDDTARFVSGSSKLEVIAVVKPVAKPGFGAIAFQSDGGPAPGPGKPPAQPPAQPPANKPPVCSFKIAPERPRTGTAVTFDASGSSDPDGSIQDYRWEFGDGTCATGVKATKRYHLAGSYQVRLAVTDDKKASACCTKTISVLQADSLSPGRLDWINGQALGAGEVSKTDGFKFTGYTCSLVGKKRSTLTPVEKRILATADDLFKELKGIAKARRSTREKTPGKTYRPAYTAKTDPAQAFATWLFQKFIENKNQSGAQIVETMATSVDPLPAGMDPPAGIEGGPNRVYVTLYEDKANVKSFSTGSQFLLGYCTASTWDDKTDFDDQTQNVTDILHFNTGLGWNTGSASYEGNYRKLMQAVKNARSRRNDLLVKIALALARPRATAEKRREFFDVANLAYAFGGGPLDAFIAYDIASFEGFHVFAIDAFNDIIATEAGRLFAEALKKKTAKEIKNATADSIRELLDDAFETARTSFASHKVLVNAEAAFKGMLLATDGCGKFVPVVERYKWKNDTIWRATLGTILHKNRESIESADDQAAFVEKIVNHLNAGIGKDGNWEAITGKTKTGKAVSVSAEDVQSLNQVVEVLMLLP